MRYLVERIGDRLKRSRKEVLAIAEAQGTRNARILGSVARGRRGPTALSIFRWRWGREEASSIWDGCSWTYRTFSAVSPRSQSLRGSTLFSQKSS